MFDLMFDPDHAPAIVRNIPTELRDDHDVLFVVEQHSEVCMVIHIIDQLLTGQSSGFTMEEAIEQLDLIRRSKGKTLGHSKPVDLNEARSLVDIRSMLDGRRLLIERKLKRLVESRSNGSSADVAELML